MPALASDSETVSPQVETPVSHPDRDDDTGSIGDSPATPGTTTGTGSTHTGQTKFKTRRSVACKSCHNLKVKCTPADESNPSGPCVRCMNAKRKCEIDLHQPRKRRRKAEVLAAAAAHNQDHTAGTTPRHDSHPMLERDSFAAEPNGHDIMSNPSVSHIDTRTSTPAIPGPPPIALAGNSDPSSVAAIADSFPKSDKDHIRMLQERVRFLEGQLKEKNGSSASSPPFVCKLDIERELQTLSEINLVEITNYLRYLADQRVALTRNSVTDVVTLGIITMDEAEVRFNLYKRMFESYPMVEIPENLDCERLRKKYPIFFNALMSVSNSLYTSGGNDLIPAMKIDNEAVKSIALESVLVGTKSQELVRSLLLLCLWYNSPELFRQRRYHLLNGLCVTLFHDLGATGKSKYSFKHEQATMSMTFSEDITVEYRSLILILYFTTVSICLILRRNIYVRWTSFVEDYCISLENSGNKRWLRIALTARLCHELDRIHHSIHQIDSVTSSSSTAKYLISDFEHNLHTIQRRIDPNDHILLSYYYSVEAYLHEPKLKEIFTTDVSSELRKVDEWKMKQVSNCTRSCLYAIDEFIALGPDEAAMAPLFASCRVIYTAGMLLRLRFLILSLPSMIDKSLVPPNAIRSVLTLLELLDHTTKMHPNNHFLNKTRLVLRLFIQTYVTQVKGLLMKNGETPQNFRSVGEHEPGSLTHQLGELDKQMVPQMDSMPNPNVPLDILSYAASFRRDDKGDPNSKTNSRNTPAPHTPVTSTLTAVPSIPTTAAPAAPSVGSSSTTTNASTQQRLPKLNGVDEVPTGPRNLIQTLHLDFGELRPHVYGPRPSIGSGMPGSPLPPIRIPTPNESSMGHLMNGGDLNGGVPPFISGGPGPGSGPGPGPGPGPGLGPGPGSGPTVPGSSMFLGSGAPFDGNIKPDPAYLPLDLNAESLDPTLSINEEFWGDLLSSNETNTLNFSRSNDDYQNQELFFP